MDDKRLFIQDEQGNEVEYEIILTFTSTETNINYVVYKELGETDEVLAARYEETDDMGGTLLELETDEEYDMIQEVIDSFFTEDEE
ncbi:DUF1292 domain-containing protein [Candidatus Xianfuyuplasma coldseepsis]|uniref:DUF1292 domain-containing protein n=1 Tax=Candidatus Xianfuyuplasma coldseepsis TaxID=2782163 RepID=A0A7L7KUD9_9MOLU|nr:DUF1292 domain-containing protein [Xianfuyuplasma coldseepsis]QMS85614.1 DUF1292 domain-containing protein [Xianfuyuplasma coldseepsis]